jgi:hypothetical protein
MTGSRIITEVVLSYQAAVREKWNAGDKSLLPPFAERPPILFEQPHYHFGEALALRHYHMMLPFGWKGFSNYALGKQFPHSARRLKGRLKVEEVIPRKLLEHFRAVRSDVYAGEPDLFLYRDDGSFMFVEVKRSDRLGRAQMTCIAHILSIFKCEVDIVRVCDESRVPRPRSYQFDLGACTGERLI